MKFYSCEVTKYENIKVWNYKMVAYLWLKGLQSLFNNEVIKMCGFPNPPSGQKYYFLDKGHQSFLCHTLNLGKNYFISNNLSCIFLKFHAHTINTSSVYTNSKTLLAPTVSFEFSQLWSALEENKVLWKKLIWIIHYL